MSQLPTGAAVRVNRPNKEHHGKQGYVVEADESAAWVAFGDKPLTELPRSADAAYLYKLKKYRFSVNQLMTIKP